MSNIIYITNTEGRESIAWITEIPHRHHAMYRVEFESGYENIFFTDVETGRWIEEDLGTTALAITVGNEIRKFMRNPYHVPKELIWHTQYEENSLVAFGFTYTYKGSHKLYELYGNNRKYMYTLADMGNDEWQIMGNSTLAFDKIDAVFAQRVIQILPLYSDH